VKIRAQYPGNDQYCGPQAPRQTDAASESSGIGGRDKTQAAQDYYQRARPSSYGQQTSMLSGDAHAWYPRYINTGTMRI
jgi:hypothetical protein